MAGGSEGIGAAFALALAARGISIVLVALPGEALSRTAALVRARGVEVVEAGMDLGAMDVGERLAAIVGERAIGLLVYNAAASPIGSFLGTSLDEKLRVIDVNCRGPVVLADRYGREMAARGRGGIVLLSSMAGGFGTALVGTYGASKAFNQVLAEAMWAELSSHGVDVLAVRPGATRTPGWERSSPVNLSRLMSVLDPEQVVTEALAALGREPSIVTGRYSR